MVHAAGVSFRRCDCESDMSRSMREKVHSLEAINVRVVGVEVDPGVFRLSFFDQTADYCDLGTGMWIWSIGRHNASGEILASVDDRFFTDPDYDCLWLR
jgi:hypothetical protein